MPSMEVVFTRSPHQVAHSPEQKVTCRQVPRKKMLIYAERSRNVYENKQNMDKVTGECADIFGLATTTERQNAASSAKKRAMGATESRKAPAQVAVNRPTSDRYTNTTSVVPAVCAGRRDRSSGAGTRTAKAAVHATGLVYTLARLVRRGGSLGSRENSK